MEQNECILVSIQLDFDAEAIMDAYLQSAAQLRQLAARVTDQAAKERMLAFASEYEAMSAAAANHRRRGRRRIPNAKEPVLSPLERFNWRGNV